MGYHSIIYIFLFLPVCLLAYQLAPEKWRGRVLLAFSWIFFYLLSGKLLVYLLGTTLLTHYPLYWHLADFAQNRRSKSRGRHGSETKESN